MLSILSKIDAKVFSMVFTDFFFSNNLLNEDSNFYASDSSSDGTCAVCIDGVEGLIVTIGVIGVIGVEVGVVTFASSTVLATLVPSFFFRLTSFISTSSSDELL